MLNKLSQEQIDLLSKILEFYANDTDIDDEEFDKVIKLALTLGFDVEEDYEE